MGKVFSLVREKIMKYNELKNGDLFKICREKNNNVYVKNEYFISDYVSGTKYGKLNGNTKIIKVGEL